jgi:hypothetical protein
MPIKRGYKILLEEAGRAVRAIPPARAKELLGGGDTLFVDVRDVRELEREGMVPGAFHAPRGMLEFWVDPESSCYNPVFTEDNTYILYCQAGRRGVLAAATLKEMGLPICSILPAASASGKALRAQRLPAVCGFRAVLGVNPQRRRCCSPTA